MIVSYNNSYDVISQIFFNSHFDLLLKKKDPLLGVGAPSNKNNYMKESPLLSHDTIVGYLP